MAIYGYIITFWAAKGISKANAKHICVNKQMILK